MPLFKSKKKDMVDETTQETQEEKTPEVGVPTGESCPHCGGSGLKDWNQFHQAATEMCTECNGSGRI